MDRIDMLEDILMQLPAQVSIMKGPEHRFVLVNPPAQEVLGDRNVINQPVREAFPDLEGQGFFELLDQVYTTRSRFEQKAVPARFKRNGEFVDIFVDITYLPLIGRSGEVEGVISFTYDVTDSVLAKKAAQEGEERLRLAYDDLEVKVKFRNLELERKNLELTDANMRLLQQVEANNGK